MSRSSAGRRLGFCLLGALLVLALAAPAGGSEPPPGDPGRGASEDQHGDIAPGVVLIRFKAGTDRSREASALSAQGAAEADEVDPIRVKKLRVPPGREREVAARLRANPDVEFAEVASLVYALWTPNDAYYAGNQWNLPKVNLPKAWDATRGRSGISVAVIDSGLDTTHPDRPTSLRLGKDYVDGGAVEVDLFGHGTHVAGIVAARTNNAAGVAGVAPGITVLAIRVLKYNSGDPDNVAKGIIEAADSGARIINLSLGTTDDIQTVRSAVEYAQGRGVLVVAAAGNSYAVDPPYNPVIYPAAYPGVLAVAATTISDTRAPYSEVQSYVDVAAPGGDASASILSLCPVAQGSYCWMAGTSMAAPHVSGLAALIWSERSFLTASQVANLIKSSAHPLGSSVPNAEFGYGRIDAAAAMEMTQAIPIHRVQIPIAMNLSP